MARRKNEDSPQKKRVRYMMMGGAILGGEHAPMYIKKKEKFKSAPLAGGGAAANIADIFNAPFVLGGIYSAYGKKQAPRVKEFLSDKPYGIGEGPVFNKERKMREERLEDLEAGKSELKHNLGIKGRKPPCLKEPCLKWERKIAYKLDNILTDSGGAGRPVPLKKITKPSFGFVEDLDKSPDYLASASGAPKIKKKKGFDITSPFKGGK